MSTTDETDSVVAAARQAAIDAEDRSETVIRPVDDLADVQAVVALFDRLWANVGPPIVGVEHLRALAHSGNYVVGAYDGASSVLVAASVGFFGAPPGQTLHSDVTGVDPTARDRGLGMALKLHQRAWALDLGLDEITWTFDPLVSRNAHFNLAKLGAEVAEYCVDFYGDMDDGVNAGQGSDRLLARWRLRDGRLDPPSADHASPILRDVDGRPTRTNDASDAHVVAIAVPRDIQAVREANPDVARAWRLAVRDTLGAELAGGARVAGFATPAGYLVERTAR